MRRNVVILAAVVAMAGAACSSSGGGGATRPPPTTGSLPPVSLSPPPGDVVTITMQDFKFVPAALTIKNTQAIHLVNKGSAVHNLSIEGTAVDADMQPGSESQDLPPPGPPLSPGPYVVFCKYHKAAGMVAAWVVVAG